MNIDSDIFINIKHSAALSRAITAADASNNHQDYLEHHSSSRVEFEGAPMQRLLPLPSCPQR